MSDYPTTGPCYGNSFMKYNFKYTRWCGSLCFSPFLCWILQWWSTNHIMHILFKVDLRQVWNPVIFWVRPGKAETKSSERSEQTGAKSWIERLKLLGHGPTPIFSRRSPAACSQDTLILQRTSVSFISLILSPVLVILQEFCHCHSRLLQRQSYSVFPCTL